MLLELRRQKPKGNPFLVLVFRRRQIAAVQEHLHAPRQGAVEAARVELDVVQAALRVLGTRRRLQERRKLARSPSSAMVFSSTTLTAAGVSSRCSWTLEAALTVVVIDPRKSRGSTFISVVGLARRPHSDFCVPAGLERTEVDEHHVGAGRHAAEGERAILIRSIDQAQWLQVTISAADPDTLFGL